MKFEGIYTPAITPYRDDGEIDRDGFVAVVDHLVTSGVHGVIIGGSTGEYYAQSLEGRIELVAVAREVIGTRGPALIVGTGALRQSDSIFVAEAAARIGADAIFIGSPPYSVPTERENALNALAIDRAAGLPVMLYNYPARMGVMMGEEVLDRRPVAELLRHQGELGRHQPREGEAFVEPTILDIADRQALPAREEIVGPILSVLTVNSFDEAVALANDTEYGLAASIFTSNVKKAIRGARAIRAGTVSVNAFGEGDITTPFGGCAS